MTIEECNKRIKILRSSLEEVGAAIGILCQCEIERLQKKIGELNG